MTEGKEPYDSKAARLRFLVHLRGWRMNSVSDEIALLFADEEVSDYAKASCYVAMLEYAGMYKDPSARLVCQRVSSSAQKSLNLVQELLLTAQTA